MADDLQVTFNIDDEEQFDCLFSIDATTFDYEALDKKPKINDVTLIGNKTSEQLGLQPLGDYATNDTVIEIRDNLQDSIDGVSQEVSQEASDREDADEVLQEQITANTNNFANYRTSAQQDVIDSTKQDVINDLETIRSNAQSGKSASDTIATYGNIVTHNVDEFATASQGLLADTSLQPNDNISELTNDVGYITSASLPTVNDGTLTIQANGEEIATFSANQSSDVTANITIPDSATWGNITGTLSNQTDLQNALNGKQATLTQGDNITIANNTISVSNTLSTQVEQNTEDIKNIQLFKFPNANIIGEPLVNNGNVSRFSSSDYMTFPFVVDVRNKEFYIEFCYTTTSDVTTQQNIIDSYFGLAIAIQNGKWTVAASSNGASWDIGVATGTNDIQPNTTYHVRAGWDLTTYYLDFALESEEYTRDITTSSTLGLFPTTIYIGGSPNLFGTGSAHPALGTINMNHCYLYISGLLVWQGMDSAGMATRADVSLSNLDSVGQLKFDNKQDKLTAGTGIDITNNVISNTQTSAEWGNIEGTLADQTDLKNALDGKQPTGDYALTSQIPTNNNQLTNGAGYITSSYHDSTKYDASNPNGYTSNTGTITGITMNGASKGTSGVVDLGTVITSHQSLDSCVKTSGNQTVAGVKTFTGTPVFSNANLGGQLTVLRSGSDNYSEIRYHNSTGKLGAIGISNSSTKLPYFTTDNSTYRTLVRGAAGSSAVNKTAIGSSSQPVYVSADGIATACTLKHWTGTKAQYDAITTKDSNTLYNITDDTDITLSLLQTIYPVGSIYITTNASCPLASLFGTWTKVASNVVTSLSLNIFRRTA